MNLGQKKVLLALNSGELERKTDSKEVNKLIVEGMGYSSCEQVLFKKLRGGLGDGSDDGKLITGGLTIQAQTFKVSSGHIGDGPPIYDFLKNSNIKYFC